MKIDKRYYILLVLIPALLLISACSPTVGTGTGNSSISVLQLLQNSAQAMKNLKSAHIVTQTNGMLQTFGSTTTPTAGTPTPTPGASQVTFIAFVSVEGADHVLPPSCEPV